MNINRVDQQTFGANLVFAKEAGTCFNKSVNLKNVSEMFAKRTKNLKTDMLVKPVAEKSFIVEFGKEGSLAENATPIISWGKVKEDNVLVDKFVKLYDMFLAKFYAKKALNRGDVGDSAHFDLRVAEIAAKSEDMELMKVAIDLIDSEY